jgi:hypothetical protein
MNFKDRYDFWTDRKADGFIYRFAEYEIKRHAIGGPEHWLVWQDFETTRDCARAWRTICDRAEQEAKAHA